VKGSGRGGQHQQHQPGLSEGGGGFAVHTSVYGKVQTEPGVTPNDQQRKKEEKEACWLPKVGWLATYAGYVPCLSTCLYWGGGIHPTTLDSAFDNSKAGMICFAEVNGYSIIVMPASGRWSSEVDPCENWLMDVKEPV
jgi:hypothetical protein